VKETKWPLGCARYLVPGTSNMVYGKTLVQEKKFPVATTGILSCKKTCRKKWFSRKYYSSVLNLRDFLADNIGQSFVGLVAKALDDNYRRYNH
jgi:hypothetical protein